MGGEGNAADDTASQQKYRKTEIYRRRGEHCRKKDYSGMSTTGNEKYFKLMRRVTHLEIGVRPAEEIMEAQAAFKYLVNGIQSGVLVFPHHYMPTYLPPTVPLPGN